jgi:hypothetical protein
MDSVDSGERGRYGFHDDNDEGALLLCDGGGGAHRLRGSHCHRSTRADKRPGDEGDVSDAVFGRAVPFAGDGVCVSWLLWWLVAVLRRNLDLVRWSVS